MADRKPPSAEEKHARALVGPDNEQVLEAIARYLHYNESIHLHELLDSREPCSYCWLRAAKSLQAIDAAGLALVSGEQLDQLKQISARIQAEAQRAHAKLDELEAEPDEDTGGAAAGGEVPGAS